MNSHPVNLAVRFLLELTALGIFAAWGWQQGQGWQRWALAIGLPLAAAAIWGIFRVPNDPGPATVAVHGLVRLSIEAVFFGMAVWALNDLKAEKWSWAMLVILLVHYTVSYDRIGWLLKQ
jgi:hypothetical protein